MAAHTAAMTSITSLFLRVDGTLLLARGGDAIEVHLSAEQLLTLGIDALRVAVALQPKLMDAAADALERTHVLPMTEAAWASIN
jgi:hypothetical protein